MGNGILTFVQLENQWKSVSNLTKLCNDLKIPITIVTQLNTPDDLSINVRRCPWLDDDAVMNDYDMWKAYWATNYDKTLVLPPCSIITENVHSIFELTNDLSFSTHALDYKYDKLVSNDMYNFLQNNKHLHYVSSDIYCFKKSELASEYFSLLELVITNWGDFYNRQLGLHKPESLNLDVCFMIAYYLLIEKIEINDFYMIEYIKIDQFKKHYFCNNQLFVNNFNHDKIVTIIQKDM